MLPLILNSSYQSPSKNMSPITQNTATGEDTKRNHHVLGYGGFDKVTGMRCDSNKKISFFTSTHLEETFVPYEDLYSFYQPNTLLKNRKQIQPKQGIDSEIPTIFVPLAFLEENIYESINLGGRDFKGNLKFRVFGESFKGQILRFMDLNKKNLLWRRFYPPKDKLRHGHPTYRMSSLKHVEPDIITSATCQTPIIGFWIPVEVKNPEKNTLNWDEQDRDVFYTGASMKNIVLQFEYDNGKTYFCTLHQIIIKTFVTKKIKRNIFNYRKFIVDKYELKTVDEKVISTKKLPTLYMAESGDIKFRNEQGSYSFSKGQSF